MRPSEDPDGWVAGVTIGEGSRGEVGRLSSAHTTRVVGRASTFAPVSNPVGPLPRAGLLLSTDNLKYPMA